VFWVLYFMFVMVAASGLMATAQLAPIAIDFSLAEQQVNILIVTVTTLSAALVIDNILNGLARPFFGWISDPPWEWCSRSERSPIGGSAQSDTRRMSSSCSLAWFSSRGAKSSACFPRLPPILMAQRLPRPMRVSLHGKGGRGVGGAVCEHLAPVKLTCRNEDLAIGITRRPRRFVQRAQPGHNTPKT
jgi:hypothetical protein